MAKPKPSPAQGEKRAAETPAEELRDEVTPAVPAAGTSPASEMQVEGPQPGDVSTLTKAKRQLKALIKRKNPRYLRGPWWISPRKMRKPKLS